MATISETCPICHNNLRDWFLTQSRWKWDNPEIWSKLQTAKEQGKPISLPLRFEGIEFECPHCNSRLNVSYDLDLEGAYNFLVTIQMATVPGDGYAACEFCGNLTFIDDLRPGRGRERVCPQCYDLG